MKQFCRIFVPMILVCALTLLAGCSNNEAANKSNGLTWDLSNAEPVYVSEWPENEFTSQIIKPENGEIDYIYDYSDSGRYAVFMKDMSEEKSAEYIEELKEQGYSEIASEGNDVSVGTMMKKDNVILSISYSGEIFGIMITIESDT
ncbi:hypothetical protein [Ruminococcus sp.]|jgi:uncharacterized protein (DUF2147 family)|uniref:hypothetical protein n=1 Tax=Ruminococcus sp. TaxID=41978 RepID=UPI003AAB82E2